jgi:hypothetical protein
MESFTKALDSFNFGPICKWFETVYVDSKSCVINNGHISNIFILERGRRRGDPLSPYLLSSRQRSCEGI